jgi:hypothetical protein
MLAKTALSPGIGVVMLTGDGVRLIGACKAAAEQKSGNDEITDCCHD